LRPRPRRAQVMAAALGVPSTQHTYEDIQLTLEALKADYPVEASVVEFNEVSAVGRASKGQAFRPCARTRARATLSPPPLPIPRSSAKRCT